MHFWHPADNTGNCITKYQKGNLITINHNLFIIQRYVIAFGGSFIPGEVIPVALILVAMIPGELIPGALIPRVIDL